MRTPLWGFEGLFMMAGASNGHCHGGDFLLAPHAKVDDGLLDIHLITDMHPLRRLRQIPKVKKGEHITLAEVQMHQAPWLEFSSTEKLLAHLDGEPFTIIPGISRVEILPAELQVIVG
jgi:diacylglycerol kinase (ATP)